jgi:molybdopterin-guanine dinucleotide biosynthesis protein A
MGRMSTPTPVAGGQCATVTGLVLAGGQARRMGGSDKGLVPLAGRPMVEHVIQALRPQVGSILLSANRNRERYARYGHPVIADDLGDYPGPLAGVAAALRHCTSEFLVTVPCDAPLLPPDLVVRLLAAREAGDADAAVVHDGRRLQPVFLLLHSRVAPSLEAYLADGGRRVDAWLGQLRAVVADFSDRADAFVNVNEPDERQAVEVQLLSSGGAG